MTEDLKSAILSRIDPPDVWRRYFPEWREGKPVRCPFHEDKKPSLSLSTNGKGLCHGCGWKCSSIVGFVADRHEIPFKRALRRIRRLFTNDTVPASEWKAWHATLMSRESAEIRKRLGMERGLSEEIMRQHQLGWHRGRMTIPILDELGDCVNVRMHDALRLCEDGKPKTVSYRAGSGAAKLFPVTSLRHDKVKVYMFEGEPDTLLALRLGLNAICVTGGARAWRDEWAGRFAGRKVVVCHDVNDPDNAGQDGAAKKCRAIAPKAAWVKNVRLPIEDRGGDLTDYVVKHGHSVNDFLELERSTSYFKEPAAGEQAQRGLDYTNAKEVPLKAAAHPEHFGKPIHVRCLVASMDLSPFVPPRRVKVACHEFARHQAAGKIPPKCGACWMPEAGLEKELEFRPEERELIAILEKNDQRADHGMRRMSAIPLDCDVEFEIKEVHNTHMVGVVPDVSSERSKDGRHDYVLRTGYFFGRGVEANRTYRFTGMSTGHPDTQQVTHVFVKAESMLHEIDRFSLCKEQTERLDSLFSAKGGDPYDKIMEVYEDLAAHVTRIVRRPLLHAAADLVWHSPLRFEFNGETIPKGWLEAIIFGDTRCGKGYVIEGLARHYGLGELVSGENCSFAGLVGGLEQTGKRLMLRWGPIPLNDRGLVIIDELSGMTEDIFGRLSRVRSEGLAEVTKIGHHQRTLARTRLIWVCNPIEGTMADYTYGVQALQRLVGKAEDIARFDYAFAVADGEVPQSAINAMRAPTGKSAYGKDDCKALVQWVWSRKSRQVRFTERAVSDILGVHSRDLSAKYSPAIPLIQGQNVRVKLAKIAAAVAGRVFNHPRGDCETLLVDGRCAETAARLLDEFYKTPCLGYDSYSRKAALSSRLQNEVELSELFSKGVSRAVSLDLVRCLLSKRVSLKALAASARMDKAEAELRVLDPLLRCNAVTERSNGYYGLTPPFKVWLERKEWALEGHAVQTAMPER